MESCQSVGNSCLEEHTGYSKRNMKLSVSAAWSLSFASERPGLNCNRASGLNYVSMDGPSTKHHAETDTLPPLRELHNSEAPVLLGFPFPWRRKIRLLEVKCTAYRTVLWGREPVWWLGGVTVSYTGINESLVEPRGRERLN